MAGYRGHLVAAVVVFGFVCLVLVGGLKFSITAVRIGELLLCCMLGALFPDIDIKSKGQQIWYSLLLLFALVCLVQGTYLNATIALLGACLPLVGKHRGLFHNPWWIMFCTLLVCAVGAGRVPQGSVRWVGDALFFLVGAWSHILLDRWS